MPRESQRSSSSSSASSIFMRGPFTRSTTSPPSLNRQNSHTARQECSVSPPGGATSLLFKVASASLKTSPRSSPPASPRQCPVDVQEVQWDVLSRRLSENRHEGYVSFPDFDRLCEPQDPKSGHDGRQDG
ncbi:hypothetical protein M436DRAFT_61491 [Aureobasidium namibiae CBS 147.97]|uniref:EF-hand domain-containing protein n=1 Tax=Aureobasidium namibiae CBS 147.97 TaxID=1043004 RepID=A0A074WXK6_9PEZI